MYIYIYTYTYELTHILYSLSHTHTVCVHIRQQKLLVAFTTHGTHQTTDSLLSYPESLVLLWSKHRTHHMRMAHINSVHVTSSYCGTRLTLAVMESTLLLLLLFFQCTSPGQLPLFDTSSSHSSSIAPCWTVLSSETNQSQRSTRKGTW